MSGGERKPEYKTIKVKDDTFRELTKIKSLLQIVEGRLFSYDDVIAFLMSFLPEIEIRWDTKEKSKIAEVKDKLLKGVEYEE